MISIEFGSRDAQLLWNRVNHREGHSMRINDSYGLSRRTILKGSAAGIAAASVPLTDACASAQPVADPSSDILLHVNGKVHRVALDNRTTLLDALRDHLKMTGTKKGCDQGQCGACTVVVNGQRINSCLTLAIMHQNDEIETIEGLGTVGNLHPMQAAFIKHDGYQCGYCTPGQICSALSVIREIAAGVPSHVTIDLMATPLVNEEEIRERMSGNICRCGAYSNILSAMLEVAGDKA